MADITKKEQHKIAGLYNAGMSLEAISYVTGYSSKMIGRHIKKKPERNKYKRRRKNKINIFHCRIKGEVYRLYLPKQAIYLQRHFRNALYHLKQKDERMRENGSICWGCAKANAADCAFMRDVNPDLSGKKYKKKDGSIYVILNCSDYIRGRVLPLKEVVNCLIVS